MLQKQFSYLQCLENVDKIRYHILNIHLCIFQWILWKNFWCFSFRLQSALESASTEEAVSEFASLRQLRDKLQTSSCSNLVAFVSNTLHFWQNTLREKLARSVYSLISLNIPDLFFYYIFQWIWRSARSLEVAVHSFVTQIENESCESRGSKEQTRRMRQKPTYSSPTVSFDQTNKNV